jgi:hypothetical protein
MLSDAEDFLSESEWLKKRCVPSQDKVVLLLLFITRHLYSAYLITQLP